MGTYPILIMWVCICNDVTDSTIRQLAQSGHDIGEVMEETKCAMTCGRCYETLVEIFDEVTVNNEDDMK